MKQKLFTLLLALATCVGTIFAEKVQIGELYYNLNDEDKTAEVTSQNSSYPRWSKSITTANIPATVTYNSLIYNVMSIGEYAFFDCSQLTSVTIGNRVTSIGKYAFDGCSSLTSITIPNSVTSIGSGAFYGCRGLISIEIPNSVTSIGTQAFLECSNLTSVTLNSNTIVSKAHTQMSEIFGSQVKNYVLGDEILSIGESAFNHCANLKSVTIGQNVISIGGWAFYECTGLISIEIPNSVTSIGKLAFYGCSSLASINIPNSVMSIGESAFTNCSSLPVDNNLRYADTYLVAAADTTLSTYTIKEGTRWIGYRAFREYVNLTSITIPNSVTSIGSAAFYGCTNLTSIEIPNSVTSVESYTFYKCKSLASVTIGNNVTSIGSYAFNYCSSLTSISIPNSVTSMGASVFYGCTGLKSPTYNAHVFAYMPQSYSGSYAIPNGIEIIADGAFAGCIRLTSIEIPNSVTYINDGAFSGCTGLTSVELPNSVTSIGLLAFGYCTSLTSITIGNSVTSVGEYAFEECSSLTDIYATCGDLRRVQQLFPNDNRVKYKPFTSHDVVIKATNGQISLTFGEGASLCDATVSVLCNAHPDDCFYFVRWADGNAENPRTIEVRQGDVIEAIFDYQISGKCGKDSALTWTLDTLTMALNITGKGSLSENYTYGRCIESLTLGNEISSIGKEAFKNFNNLKNIILGSSVRILEENAFDDCTAVQTITCYTQRPPTVKDNALNRIDYNAIVYVPADYLETYKMHETWGLYDVRPLGAAPTETTDVKVTTTENTATVAWPAVESAYTYELVIKDKSGNVICTLVFNAQGQLLSIAFNAPANGKAPQQTQSAGFSFTVTGLEEGTTYNLLLTAKDESGNELDQQTVSFTTTGGEQSIEDIYFDAPQATKILLDGQIYILRGEHVYDTQGKMVR